MEKQAFDDYNPHLFPRVERAAEAVKTLLRLGRVTELCLSEHRQEQAPAQLQIDFEGGNGTPAE